MFEKLSYIFDSYNWKNVVLTFETSLPNIPGRCIHYVHLFLKYEKKAVSSTTAKVDLMIPPNQTEPIRTARYHE